MDMGHRTPRLFGYKIEGDLSGKLYHFVKFGTAAGTITAVTAATDAVVGILYDYTVDGKDGDIGDVALVGGGSKVVVAATLAAGSKVTTDATGKAVAATSGDQVCASLENIGASAVAGDAVACEVMDQVLA